MLAKLGLLLIGALLAISPAHAAERLVGNPAEYANAAAQLQPGAEIVLADGEWRDFEIVVRGEGTERRPIRVRSQTPGKVVLTGQSSLRIGGRHIHVSGLVFRDGHSPRGEVVSFRIDKDNLAFDSRISHVVIDGFSKPDRNDTDYWVGLYGRNNRFDHNHLVGKTNKGVTLAVRLDGDASRENGHRIDHNYFGPRPVLGSNGGETLRIGTSHYATFNSNTLVESNVFDRCDGEVEIISVKSGGNVVRRNLFLRSRGSLTLRHGDGNLVERNVFLGHGKDYTGGIRVINRNQTVRDNYLEGLRGDGFASALAVMNGVPDSPANRYVEVENARIENNTIVDSRRIAFNVGADEERSVAPSASIFRRNLLVGVGTGSFVEAYGDVSGIAFSGNRVLQGGVIESVPLAQVAPAQLVREANGLLYPADPELADIGAPRDLSPTMIEDVGVEWYPKPDEDDPFASSRDATTVAPGLDTLIDAVANAAPGDVLRMQPGEYLVERVIPVMRPVTISGASADIGEPSIVRFSRPVLFELQEKGSLKLANLVIDGALAPDATGNSVIRTTSFPIQSNMQVHLTDVTVRNLNVNRSFNVLTLGKGTLADRVKITGSSFSGISGAIVSAAAETEDYGQYNVEYLTITDSSFEDVGGPIADIYRGGRDESTFGPSVRIEGNSLANVGKAATNGRNAAIYLHGVQAAGVGRNQLRGSAPLRIVHTVGDPRTGVYQNNFSETPAPELEELVFDGPFRIRNEPLANDGVDPE